MKQNLKEVILIVVSLCLLLIGAWADLAKVPMAGAVSLSTISFGGWFRVGVVSILLVIGLIGIFCNLRTLSIASISLAVGFFTEMLLSGIYWYQEKTSLMAEMAGASSIQKAIEFGTGGPLVLGAWLGAVAGLVMMSTISRTTS